MSEFLQIVFDLSQLNEQGYVLFDLLFVLLLIWFSSSLESEDIAQVV